MAYAFRFAYPTVNYDPSGTTHTSIAETGGTAVALGDHCVFAVLFGFADHTISSFVSSIGNTYTEIPSSHIYDSGTTVGFRFFEGICTHAGTETVTATYDSAAGVPGLFGACYSGLAGAVDSVGTSRLQTSVAASAGAVVTNGVTVVNQPVMLVSLVMDFVQTNGDDITAVGSTSRVSAAKAGGGATIIRLCDQRVTANGSATASWTPVQAGANYFSMAFAIAENVVVPTYAPPFSTRPNMGALLQM